MKPPPAKLISLLGFLCYVWLATGVYGGFVRPTPPFSAAAGQPTSTAIAHNDPRIVGWASAYTHYLPGLNVSSEWQTPANALGPVGTDTFDVVVLGDGGEITMIFDPPISNGPGFDFAVFENSFSDFFLELAFVEVSSDGVHFARFPNYSLTAARVWRFGTVDPRMVYGLAGKYRVGFGTPFDLEELAQAFALASSREVWLGPQEPEFSQAYRDSLVSSFPFVDLSSIRYVRIVDIVGDGSALDSEGFVIYDPHPTQISAGFDLSGVAALNVAQADGPLPLPSIHLAIRAHTDSNPRIELTVAFDPAQHSNYTIQLSQDLANWTTLQPPAVRPHLYDLTGKVADYETWFIRLLH